MNERPRFLANLAEEDRSMQTPRRVETALRQRVAASRKPNPWRWALAAAAAIVFAVVSTFRQPVPPPPSSVAVATPAPSVTKELPPTVAPVRTTAVKRALPRVAAPVQQRITRRFYELAYAPPELLANSRMMRVRVPRAALLSFGLPLSAYRAQDEKVAADVIYTEDGIARAIRFIENNQQ